jgi:hypothetical protein
MLPAVLHKQITECQLKKTKEQNNRMSSRIFSHSHVGKPQETFHILATRIQHLQHFD